MNEYVVDTVGLVRYLEDRLPSKSERVFNEDEGVGPISSCLRSRSPNSCTSAFAVG